MKTAGTKRVKPSPYFHPFEPIVPNRWQGEYDCVVGPFSSQSVAEYFMNAVVDFGQYESFSRKVFAKADSWYVEVKESPINTRQPINS